MQRWLITSGVSLPPHNFTVFRTPALVACWHTRFECCYSCNYYSYQLHHCSFPPTTRNGTKKKQQKHKKFAWQWDFFNFEKNLLLILCFYCCIITLVNFVFLSICLSSIHYYPLHLSINLSCLYPSLYLSIHPSIHLLLTQCSRRVLLPQLYLLTDHVVQHGGDARAQRSKGVSTKQLRQDVQSAVEQEVALRVREVAQQRGQSEENLREARRSEGQRCWAAETASREQKIIWISSSSTIIILIIYLLLHPEWLWWGQDSQQHLQGAFVHSLHLDHRVTVRHTHARPHTFTTRL